MMLTAIVRMDVNGANKPTNIPGGPCIGKYQKVFPGLRDETLQMTP
jgi:hypothetical protein